ncbi:ribonuclease H-like domain-containing protein, partial [Tanacetum coccineum]
ISKLDISDQLHLYPNDTIALTVVSIKLKGTENYQVWSCAMLLALEGKNKIGFIDGSCKGLQMRFLYDAIIELPKCVCNASEGFKKHNQLLKLMQFIMGLDDSCTQIRSSILSRETLPDVKSAYATISSEVSHKVAVGSIVGSSQRNQASAFVSNKISSQNFKKQGVSNNNFVGKSLSSGFTDEQMATLISLIKDNKVRKNVQANMADTYFNKRANQHMTYTDKELDNIIDISYLKIKVGHPNRTDAYISKIGNLRLSNGLTLYDVMVILEYCVTLIFVHKLIKENKVVVAFDENRCYFLNQDLNLKNVLGIGEQCEGLYYYSDKDPVLNVLKDSLNFDKRIILGGIPLKMWTECILTATYLINRLSSFVLNEKSPYEMIYKKCPALSHLRVFGCLCFATIVNNDDKFSSRSEKYFFENIFPFKDSEVGKNDSTNVLQDVNHINFFDNEYPEIPSDDERVADDLNKGKSDSSSSSESGSNINTVDFPVDSGNDADSSNDFVATQNEEVATLEENIFSDGNLEQNPSSSQGVQNVRRSFRQSVFPKNYNDFVVESKVKYGLERYVSYSKLNTDFFCFITQLNKTREPKTYFEASKYSHWIDAMNQEMNALLRNGTWELVELPEGRKAIGSKWIYKIKFRSSGEIDRYKARLVAQGFGQKEGIDYEETFSPVVKMVTVRCLLNIVVSMSWPVFQLDVNNAFLYGDLEEAPRQWNAKLTSTLIENGFSQSKSDYSLYTKSDKGVFLALLVYVDDIIITGNSVSEIEKFKVFLKSKFMIKDLGKLKYFLGIKVVDIDKGICLNQRKYVLDLLSEYDYHKLMGKLIYLTNTRPDISYVVHCLSQFMHSPLTSHLKVAFKILRYLKSCPGLGVHITKTSGMFLTTYSDVDWAKCIVTRKTVTSNSAIKIATNPVFHEGTKYLEIDLHFVREKVLKGVVKTVKVDSANQIANILTKGLDTFQHLDFVKKLSMYDVYQVETKGGY